MPGTILMACRRPHVSRGNSLQHRFSRLELGGRLHAGYSWDLKWVAARHVATADPESDEKTQEWVAEALSQIGSPALAAVPSLRARLESGNRGLRIWAAFAGNGRQRRANGADIDRGLRRRGARRHVAEACDALAAIGTSAGAARDRSARRRH